MIKIFYRCNAAASDPYDGKSKNKIAVVFFFLIPMAAEHKTNIHTTKNIHTSTSLLFSSL